MSQHIEAGGSGSPLPCEDLRLAPLIRLRAANGGRTGATLGIAAPAAMAAPQACVHAYVNVNGTEQTIDQCAP